VSGVSCGERLLLPEALSGRLDPAEEKRVMAHVETCEACQIAAAEIEVSLISLAVLRDERDHPIVLAEPPSAVPEGVAGLFPPAHQTGPDTGPNTGPDVGPGTGLRTGSVAAPDQVTSISGRRRVPLRLLSAAAAVLLLAGGVAIGRAFAPGADSVDFGPALALAPPPSAADQAPRGSVAVGTEGASLAVRLTATSLPKTGWYECVWVAAGQSRSAGSFRATDGMVKDIRLRVAPPQDSQTWDLQLVHHQGTASEVVLEGAAEYHP
jgi:putative zinc finger protein